MTKHYSIYIPDSEIPTLTFPNVEHQVFPKRDGWNLLLLGSNECDAVSCDLITIPTSVVSCFPEVYRSDLATLSREAVLAKFGDMVHDGTRKCITLIDEYIEAATKVFVDQHGRQPDTLVTMWKSGPTIIIVNDETTGRETCGFDIRMEVAFAVCSGTPTECEGLNESPRLSIPRRNGISNFEGIQTQAMNTCLGLYEFLGVPPT